VVKPLVNAEARVAFDPVVFEAGAGKLRAWYSAPGGPREGLMEIEIERL